MSEEDLEAFMCALFPQCKPMSKDEKDAADRRVAQRGYKNMPFPNIIHNREFLDIEVDILLSFENQYCIMLDRANKEIYHMEYIMGTIYYETTALLLKVSEELAKTLEEHFSISLEEYDIEVVKSEDVIISMKDGEYDYE